MFKRIATIFSHAVSGRAPPTPVSAQLIGGHSNKRRTGTSLTDGNLNPLKLWKHFSWEEKTRAPDNVDELSRTQLCRENIKGSFNADCKNVQYDPSSPEWKKLTSSDGGLDLRRIE